MMASPRSSNDIADTCLGWRFGRACRRRLIARLTEGVHLAGFECVRGDDHLFAGAAELVEVLVRDPPKLHVDDARVRPFAAWTGANAADYRLHLVLPQVRCQHF